MSNCAWGGVLPTDTPTLLTFELGDFSLPIDANCPFHFRFESLCVLYVCCMGVVPLWSLIFVSVSFLSSQVVFLEHTHTPFGLISSLNRNQSIKQLAHKKFLYFLWLPIFWSHFQEKIKKKKKTKLKLLLFTLLFCVTK